MRAAVDLDLWWDFGQISKEWSSWGDKFRKVGDSKNPFDFAKNLFDAMTGPLDDIVVPALNQFLLVSGVGSAVNFARLGALGVRGVEAVNAFSKVSSLYKAPGIGGLLERLMPVMDTAALRAAGTQLGEASLLANKLQQGGRVASAVGRSMEEWRALAPVIAARGMVQTGMRLGFVSQVENRLLPSYEGKSFGDVSSVAEAADSVFTNTAVSLVGEWALTPYTIFRPGTFVNGGRDAVRGAFRFLGNPYGRAVAGGIAGAGAGVVLGDDSTDVAFGAAAGATGGLLMPTIGGVVVAGANKVKNVPGLKLASKLVRPAGELMRLSEFQQVADDQRVTSIVYDAMKAKLNEEEFANFDRRINETGSFKAAFAEHVGTDETSVAGALGYTMLMGAIDRTAALQAQAGGPDGCPDPSVR
jgi:hypothetical protein